MKKQKFMGKRFIFTTSSREHILETIARNKGLSFLTALACVCFETVKHLPNRNHMAPLSFHRPAGQPFDDL